jgi:hypothetical protein
MHEWQSLSHVRWECKCHIVIIPKYRWKVFYGWSLARWRVITGVLSAFPSGRRMRRRWCVAGLLRAESKFRRVKGHRDMPTLMRALEESTRARPSGIEHGVA